MGIGGLVIGGVIGYLGAGAMPAEPSVSSVAQDTSGMHSAMTQMTSGLEGKTGDALDDAFLGEMIVHHEGAIEMAQTILEGTQRQELQVLANNIIEAQTAEIVQMKQWREEWFGH